MPDDDDPDAEAARLEQLSDEELIAEAIAEGVDVAAEGARVRGLLTDAVRQAKARRADLDCWSPALPLALAVSPASDRPALAAAIARPREPHLVVLDARPKAAEPELPSIDLTLPPITAPFDGPRPKPLNWRDHSELCRLLDGPARKRHMPFVCICGADKRSAR